MIVGSGNVEIALVEFPHAPLGHGGLVAPVHFGDVVALYGLNGRVHGEPSCEWYGKVVAEGAEFAALILQVVN